MDKELIKTELIEEIELIIKSKTDTFKNTSGIVEKLEMWNTKLDSVEDFIVVISNKLNEILERHKIVFKDESEKKELNEFLKPTFNQLVIKHIRK